jgi:hypothetical protein
MKEYLCKACHAPIWYPRHATTGRRAPVDVFPSDHGNIRVDFAHETYTLSKPGPGRHLNHYVTCPYATKFKAPQDRRRYEE